MLKKEQHLSIENPVINTTDVTSDFNSKQSSIPEVNLHVNFVDVRSVAALLFFDHVSEDLPETAHRFDCGTFL